ncbi:MAG: glycosyltransferase family 4 protein [Mucilaginibacter sp.]|uniref:glycosyltransferase family 4 protein n=1 Tax=Mucilaginibacter sp. TaxID=1882438 RepID=UPI00319FE2E8
MCKKVILFTLQTFSTTGGIQKMTRTLGYSLYHVAQANNWDFELWSAYDKPDDLMPQYLPAKNFKGFDVNKISFAWKALHSKPNIVILSHINLSIIGLLIKFINPKCEVWVVAHGIEIWRPLSFIKKQLLKRCNKILCVSNYTQQEIVNRHGINQEICVVLNNVIDPFMRLPAAFNKPQHLIDRYGLDNSNPVIFTLTRMAATEKYKGYELVINTISKLKDQYPDIKYILSGKYDTLEEVRINKLISEHQVSGQVILTGFIEEAELADHFLLADLFVLPSKKEGFGIVFIEALACGLPVICGNTDGSVDAIRNGELGKAIDTDNPIELHQGITECLACPLTIPKRKNLQELCLKYFNATDYTIKLQLLLKG